MKPHLYVTWNSRQSHGWLKSTRPDIAMIF